MGINDREYFRTAPGRGGFGTFSLWSVTTWLIVVNVAVMFVEAGLKRGMSPELGEGMDWRQYMMAAMGPLERWGYFSTDTAVYGGQIWRFITFQFLHASRMHLVVNMVGLYLFGPIVEAVFGGRRFLGFYLLCGLAGAVCYLVLSWLAILGNAPGTPLVGASAGIFGLLVASAVIAPDVVLFHYFVPVTIRTAALFSMVMAAYTIVALGHNAGGEAGHLGGGIAGLALVKNQHWLNLFVPGRASRAGSYAAVGTGRSASPARRKRKRKLLQKDWSKDMNR